MDELQIKNILCKSLGTCFKGVYSMDEWRSLKKKANPCAYVFNTQPSSVSWSLDWNLYSKEWKSDIL